MFDWRQLESDFQAIHDQFGSMRADWSREIGNGDTWRIAAWPTPNSRHRFETLARTAGDLLIKSEIIRSACPSDVINEQDSLIRWFRALRQIGGYFEIGPSGYYMDDDGQPRLAFMTGSINNIVEVSALLCLQLASAEFKATPLLPQYPLRIYIDNIDTFKKVQDVTLDDITDLINESGRIDVKEDVVQTAIEQIAKVALKKHDWSGEENDLYTANIELLGKRTPTAFLLKGRGTKNKQLQIANCGQNGDQIVRLFKSPANLFIVQYVGEISEHLITDVEGKSQLLRSKGDIVSYCIINGQDTARLLRAYGII
jgi:hypothetical protein